MKSFSFTKADRLLNRSEFQRLNTCGNKVRNKNFIALFLPGVTDRTRIGVTVSKRVGQAAVRNRIKRMTREFFRLNRHRIKNKLDINIIAGKHAAGLTGDEAYASLEDIFNKINRIQR